MPVVGAQLKDVEMVEPQPTHPTMADAKLIRVVTVPIVNASLKSGVGGGVNQPTATGAQVFRLQGQLQKEKKQKKQVESELDKLRRQIVVSEEGVMLGSTQLYNEVGVSYGEGGLSRNTKWKVIAATGTLEPFMILKVLKVPEVITEASTFVVAWFEPTQPRGSVLRLKKDSEFQIRCTDVKVIDIQLGECKKTFSTPPSNGGRRPTRLSADQSSEDKNTYWLPSQCKADILQRNALDD